MIGMELLPILLALCLGAVEAFVPSGAFRQTGHPRAVRRTDAGYAVAGGQGFCRVERPGTMLMAVPVDLDEEALFGDDVAPYYSEDEETAVRLLTLVEDTVQQLSETPLLKVLGAHVADPVNDPLLANMGGRSYDYLVSRARETFINSRVESAFLKERLSEELEEMFQSMLAYVAMYAAGQALLYPKPLYEKPLFIDEDRTNYYYVVYRDFISAREDYIKAHAAFWSDLAAILKSQQEIPSAGFRAATDPTADLPAPFGKGVSGLVLLPVPPLLSSWKDKAYGGVKQQIFDLMSLKKVIIPEIKAMRSGQGAGEALRKYVLALYKSSWRKGPRWEGQDEAAVAHITAENAEGRVKPRYPDTTGVSVPGVNAGSVRRAGIEDAWIGGKKK